MKAVRFKANSEVKLPKAMVYSVPMGGPADSAIEAIRREYTIEADREEAIKYLRSTGGWEVDELQDHDENLDRLVWLACLDCQAQKTLYWYMGS